MVGFSFVFHALGLSRISKVPERRNSLINLVRRRLANWWGGGGPLNSLISEALLPRNATFSKRNTLN